MPSPDDKLTDIPLIVPTRDDDEPAHRRPRSEAPAAARAGRTEQASAPAPGGSSRYVAILALLLALATAAVAGLLYQQTVRLDAALGQANLRIADLEGKLSVTGDNVSQSSAAMQIKIKELAGEVDKLWASAWRKNDGRLTELESGMKKAAGSYVAQQKQLTTATADISSLKEQVGQATAVAATVDTLKQQQAGLQDSIGRVSSTVNTVSNTQRAQESRIKETEQWVQSTIEFRKQVTQRLTRLENPPSSLPH
jgi:hypothetical protein